MHTSSLIVDDYVDQLQSVTTITQVGHGFTNKGQPVGSDGVDFIIPAWGVDHTHWSFATIFSIISPDKFKLGGQFLTNLSGLIPHSVYYNDKYGNLTTNTSSAVPIENVVGFAISSEVMLLLPYEATYNPTTGNEITIKKTDSSDSDIVYYAQAVSGSLESAPVWRIKRVDLGVMVPKYPNGSLDFNQILDSGSLEFESYTYTQVI